MEDFKLRLINEFLELDKREKVLEIALKTDGFFDKVGEKQYLLMEKQLIGMKTYHEALKERLNDLGITDVIEK